MNTMKSVAFCALLASSALIAVASAEKSSTSTKSSSAANSIESLIFGTDWSATKVLDYLTDALNATANSLTSRGAKSNFDGMYGMWNPGAAGKFDVLSLIPTLLIVGLGIMLLPVILSCFTQIIAPLNYQNGRKKREASGFDNGLNPVGLLDLLSTFSKAMEKYNF